MERNHGFTVVRGDEGQDPLELLVEGFAREIEARQHPFGWDIPATILDVYWADNNPDTTGLGLGDELVLGLRAGSPRRIDGHPVDWLVGRQADEDACGVALITELWINSVDQESREGGSSTEKAETASPHPQRREGRAAFCVLKDGTTASVIRTRDDNQVEANVQTRGRLIRSLRRYLGLPSDELPAESPLQVLAGLILQAGINASVDSDRWRAATELSKAIAAVAGDSVRDIDDDASGCALCEQPVPAHTLFHVAPTLALPLGLRAVAQATALGRTEWEGVASALAEHGHRLAEPYLEVDGVKEWLRWVDWADDAMVAHALVDEFLENDQSVDTSRKRFNSVALRLLDEADPEITQVYRRWLEKAAAADRVLRGAS